MSEIKKVETRKDAINVILDTLEHDEIDVIAIANDILMREKCWCGGTSAIDVINRNNGPVEVSVTKTCGVGEDRFYIIDGGEKERWSRCVFREVKIELRYGNTIKHTVQVDTHSNTFAVNGDSIHSGAW